MAVSSGISSVIAGSVTAGSVTTGSVNIGSVTAGSVCSEADSVIPAATTVGIFAASTARLINTAAMLLSVLFSMIFPPIVCVNPNNIVYI